MKKNLTPLLLAVCLAFAGCSKSQEGTTVETTVTESSVTDSPNSSESSAGADSGAMDGASASTGSVGDCDKFLTDYEDFATTYVAVSAKFAKNPNDVSVMTEYTEMATKAQEMQTNQPNACQTDEAFLKRYTSIAAKVAKAAAAQAAGSAKLMEQMSKLSN